MNWKKQNEFKKKGTFTSVKTKEGINITTIKVIITIMKVIGNRDYKRGCSK